MASGRTGQPSKSLDDYKRFHEPHPADRRRNLCNCHNERVAQIVNTQNAVFKAMIRTEEDGTLQFIRNPSEKAGW